MESHVRMLRRRRETIGPLEWMKRAPSRIVLYPKTEKNRIQQLNYNQQKSFVASALGLRFLRAAFFQAKERITKAKNSKRKREAELTLNRSSSQRTFYVHDFVIIYFARFSYLTFFLLPLLGLL